MRVALVTGPDPGHAFPCVALALRLRERGHVAVVLTGERWQPGIVTAGLEWAPLPLLAADPRDGDFGFVLWERPLLMAPLVADYLRSWRPDVVVADTVTTAGWFAADLLGVPRIELVPHTLQVPSRHLPPPGSGLELGVGLRGSLRDTVLRWFAARSRRTAAGQRDAARAVLGLPPGGDPALRLVATLPALEPDRPDWPEDTYVVGPLEWDPASIDLVPPPGAGPLVFLADTSATGRPQTLLDVAAEGLAGSAYRVVATRFSSWDGRAPHVTGGPGRQAPLLDRAAVVVCAGGHGMVAKALARGLPLVVVPGPGDQRENAVRVARLGAGLHLPASRLAPATLAVAVREVVEDPAYARAARAAAASLASVPRDLAASLIERL